MYGGDKTLVMLHAEVRNREILSEEFPVVAPGVFSNHVGVVVFDGEEELCCVELGFVVLVCLNLGGADRIVSSALDDVLVSSPYVAVFRSAHGHLWRSMVWSWMAFAMVTVD